MFGYDTLVDAKVLDVEALENAAASDQERKPVNLEVTLFCHGFPCMACHATQLGPDGLFVLAGDLSIARNAYLEVEFTLSDSKGQRLYRLPVYIHRRTEEGLDLKFVNTFTRAFHYLDS
ncbi:MAG: hypothetical protein D6717_11725 [Gammaproteobacteria bacterium]|nr:MAG: hypothetical protein D6717_11725 [Gammaproteobacteria bacterium]